jgi:two-component system sensor histidine kinase HydH
MPYEAWLAALSAAAFLALALLALLRRARHPLAGRLGLMSVGLFAYNLQEVLSDVGGARFWVWLGDAAAALAAIAAFELLLGFLGALRARRGVTIVARAYFGALALASLTPLVVPGASKFHDSGLLALLMLVGLVPCFGLVGALLVGHARRSHRKERLRAQMLGGALLLGVGSVITDLSAMTGLAVPRLSYYGLFLASLLVAAFTFESKIIEKITIAAVVNAAIVAALAVIAQIVLFSLTGERIALAIFGSLVVLLAALAAVFPLLGAISEQRARTQYLVTLGRFAQQLAHDIRNPLAAIKGTAQFLQVERAEGRSIDPHAEMLDLIVERVDRIERFIRDYQRMGRVEPALVTTDVRPIMKDALASIGERSSEVSVEERFADPLPDVRVDPDLLAFALENVVRNACDAMPDGGTLTASADVVSDAGRSFVRTRIADSGAGMDVRTKDRALAGFFTTKEGGSGLGLAFVQRVVDAHGGRLVVESEEGRGTTIEIRIPTP